MPVRANWMIVEVFENLISNAIKYSPESSEVLVAVERQEDGTVVSVADRGDGVPDAYKEGIFERFSRGEKSGVIGTGLGLAIAKHLIEAHGGRLEVESKVGRGSTFTIYLSNSSENESS